MMLDWAASLMVVSLISFGLIVTTIGFFANEDQVSAVNNGLSNTANVVSEQVDRLQALSADTTERFYYGASPQLPNNYPPQPVIYGVQMPSVVQMGVPYVVEFTHDFVVLIKNGSGTSESAYVGLDEPVYLFDEAEVQTLAHTPISSAALATLNAQYTCSAFPAGLDFQVTQESVLVSGVPTYLTILYSLDGLNHPCP